MIMMWSSHFARVSQNDTRSAKNNFSRDTPWMRSRADRAAVRAINLLNYQ
tara:strand:+ start:82359 stop:82508 length:150 start_codon:yes stop_codon:yes gene_type:complete